MERIPLNDLARVPVEVARARENLLLRVARRGWYLKGPETAGFEQELAAAVGVQGAVGVGNGTDALELALRGLRCSAGGEVVVAANAGGYATTALLRAGLRPRYADVDEQTLGLSAASVSAAFRSGDGLPQAVVITHLYGQMADVESVVALCHDHDVPVVEDCAQAIGAARGGTRVGAFGDAAAFSFYPTKNLGALGDAGAVVSDDREVLDRVRSLAQYGWTKKYRVGSTGGGNSRIDEIQAAVLRYGLTRLDEDNARRREILKRYARALPASVGHVVGGQPGTDNVAHLGVAWVQDRATAAARLDAEGVDTAVHYPVPDHRQPAWAEPGSMVVLPVTEAAASHVLSLPLFPELTDAEVDRVCAALRSLGGPV